MPDSLSPRIDLAAGVDLRTNSRHRLWVHGPGDNLVVPDLATFDIPPLEFHEQFGGHTLRRHVGTTPHQDVQRMQREPDIGATGSFLSVDLAEQAMQNTIRHHARTIQTWLRQGAPGVFVAESYFTQPVGGVLTRSAVNRGVREAAPATGARVVLVASDQIPGGFLVRSCYPVLAPARIARLRTLLPEPEARKQLLAPPMAHQNQDEPLRIDAGMARAARFLDADIGESAIDAALESWGGDIQRWVVLGGDEDYRAVHRCHDLIGEVPTGNPQNPVQPTPKIRFVLRRDDSDSGFSVVVAEPIVTPSDR